MNGDFSGSNIWTQAKMNSKKNKFHITIQGPLICSFKNDSAIGRFADVKGIGENISAGVIDCMV